MTAAAVAQAAISHLSQ